MTPPDQPMDVAIRCSHDLSCRRDTRPRVDGIEKDPRGFPGAACEKFFSSVSPRPRPRRSAASMRRRRRIKSAPVVRPAATSQKVSHLDRSLALPDRDARAMPCDIERGRERDRPIARCFEASPPTGAGEACRPGCKLFGKETTHGAGNAGRVPRALSAAIARACHRRCGRSKYAGACILATEWRRAPRDG